MADVQITAATHVVAQARAMRALVWYTALVGYFFFVNASDNLVYSKTTDGGQTWGSEVTVKSGENILAYDVWFDQQTPGDDTGTLIYAAYFGTTTSDVFMRTLDTASDTLGTERQVFAGATAVSDRGNFVSITKARSGYLYCALSIDAGTEKYLRNSTDGGATWNPLSTAFVEAQTDQCYLFPATGTGDDNDIWALYQDASADALTVKLWDNSFIGEFESSTLSSVIENSSDGGGQFSFGGSIRRSDGHLLAFCFTDVPNPTSTFKFFDVTSHSSFVEKTAIDTNCPNQAYGGVFVDELEDVIYLAYTGRRNNSETIGTTIGVYYVVSRDRGTTWVPGGVLDIQMSENLPAFYRHMWMDSRGPRFACAWQLATGNNPVFMSYINSRTFARTASFAQSQFPKNPLAELYQEDVLA